MALVKLFKLGANGVPRQHNASADELSMFTVQGGNLKMAGNSLTSEDTDGNIILDPNGTGVVNINSAYDLPAADGAADQVLTTNGSGVVSFQDSNAAQKICTTYNSAAGVTDRDVVYISGSDDVSTADASAEATSRAMGFADGAIGAAGSGPICHDGVLDGFTGLTPAARYFLSETPGLVSTAVPATDEAAVVQVGYAKSATEMHIDIEVIVEVETD